MSLAKKLVEVDPEFYLKILIINFYPRLTDIYFPYILHFFYFFAFYSKWFLFWSPYPFNQDQLTHCQCYRNIIVAILCKNHKSCRCVNRKVKIAAVISQEPDFNTFFHIAEPKNSLLPSMWSTTIWLRDSELHVQMDLSWPLIVWHIQAICVLLWFSHKPWEKGNYLTTHLWLLSAVLVIPSHSVTVVLDFLLSLLLMEKIISQWKISEIHRCTFLIITCMFFEIFICQCQLGSRQSCVNIDAQEWPKMVIKMFISLFIPMTGIFKQPLRWKRDEWGKEQPLTEESKLK